jgi:hypothetical protein
VTVARVACVAALTCASLVSLGCNGQTRDADPSPPAFAPEAPREGEGASVALRGRPDLAAPDRVAVDVVARGVPDLHGAAFRVIWEPRALAFVDAAPGPGWSKGALSLAREGAPGQLAVVWTEKGEVGLDATAETLLGTLFFVRTRSAGTALAFRAERSQLVDRKGGVREARWLGERLLDAPARGR